MKKKFILPVFAFFFAVSLSILLDAKGWSIAEAQEAYPGSAIVNVGGKCLDVKGARVYDEGAAIGIWTCNQTVAQSWRVVGNSIRNTEGKCLDVKMGEIYTDGQPVWLYTCNGSAAQQWTISGEQIRNVGGKCLDVKAGQIFTDGTDVQIYSCNGTNAQKWSIGGFANIVSRATYEAMFPNRNALYSYDSLVAATQKYPKFCNEGSLEQRKREAAAFLANIAHETTGGWDTAPGGRYAWGLYFIEEVNANQLPPSQYCDSRNTTYPCVPGQRYHGRGPIQLSWNYNYGAVGQALGVNLLANPDLVKSDSAIAFQTALWFWMTPQLPKPSAHAVMTGGWTPSPGDASQGRLPGFGMTINIINGGLECGQPTNNQVRDRVGFYQRFTQMLGVSMGENLYCDRMAHY